MKLSYGFISLNDPMCTKCLSISDHTKQSIIEQLATVLNLKSIRNVSSPKYATIMYASYHINHMLNSLFYNFYKPQEEKEVFKNILMNLCHFIFGVKNN